MLGRCVPGDSIYLQVYSVGGRLVRFVISVFPEGLIDTLP
jgi:hypothetical protein